MTITTEDFGGYILNRPSAHETLAGISDYLEAHVSEWERQEVIWDISGLKIPILTTADVWTLVARLQRIRHYRKGRSTALVCSGDLGYGMLRRLHMLLEDKVNDHLMVTRTIGEAIEQLSAYHNTQSDASGAG